jgi:hypothetical protein
MSWNRRVTLNLSAPEWDPLFAYAETQGMKPHHAAAELLLASISSNARDAAYITTVRALRGELQKIMFGEALAAMRTVMDRLQTRAIEVGVDVGKENAA